jgi:hypothetical protein
VEVERQVRDRDRPTGVALLEADGDLRAKFEIELLGGGSSG